MFLAQGRAKEELQPATFSTLDPHLQCVAILRESGLRRHKKHSWMARYSGRGVGGGPHKVGCAGTTNSKGRALASHNFDFGATPPIRGCPEANGMRHYNQNNRVWCAIPGEGWAGDPRKWGVLAQRGEKGGLHRATFSISGPRSSHAATQAQKQQRP